MGEATNIESRGEQYNQLDTLFSTLASSDRRRLVGLVADQAPEPISRDELAISLAAWSQGIPDDDVTDNEHQQAMVNLHHVHLPRLVDSELVELDTDDDTVTLADHPVFGDSGIRKVIKGDTSTTPESVDTLFAAIADARRRTIFDVLSHQYQPIQVETLAHDIGTREQDTTGQNVTPATVEQILISLQHVHLPMLAEADLIEYDTDEQTVVYEGHPDLRVPWMHSEPGSDFRTTLTDNPPEADVGSIEGRERIVSYG